MRSPILAVALLSRGIWVTAQSSGGPSNVPTTNEFLRLNGGKVAVLDNRIYYDGGHISQRGYATANHSSNTMNATLSIDLSRPWTPEGVAINEGAKPDSVGTWSYQHIWSDIEAGELYVWGGGPYYALDGLNVPQKLWKFTTSDDTNNAGNWSEVNPVLGDGNLLERTPDRRAGAAVSTATTGFVFGGYSVIGGEVTPLTGYISFDFATGEWEEHSDPDAPFSKSGTLLYSSALWAPTFGSEGLIFIMGGMETVNADIDPENLDFETIHFLDPAKKQWLSQETTGDIPDSRTRHCTVGVAGANGTYDIFLYGGANEEPATELLEMSDVHVLSLPGFKWTRLYDQSDGEGRFEQGCAVVGKRQLLSWGGSSLSLEESQSSGFARGDRNPNGLAIFDMSDGEWKTRYNPDAAAYQAHQSVSAFHTQEEFDKVVWSSDDVEALFAVARPDPPAPGADEEEGSSDDGKPKGSKTPVGAIAGGVIGGLAIVGLVVAFLIYRRRKSRRPQELEALPPPGELEGKPTPMSQYNNGHYGLTELDGNALSEIGPVTGDPYRKAHAVEVHGESAPYVQSGVWTEPRELEAK
ncbi:hypothetical protein F5X68DRAFT_197100 [Plectosphaerella plurivora]|uniref:Kelch repeat protein n=1 Tax=Plectosphaerella plurivora TaxID=936078 RepID=A0A9P8VLX0_9PEZI|nr:hypothetical protein F5X68DRAFT_197100 [Plectosphaerella plurivora]